jgi:hypothetical protein
MSRPEDIPQDVWDAAEAVEADINGPDHSAYSHAAIARAIMAERERAAKLCEEQAMAFASDLYAAGQPLSSFSKRFACGQCAEAIRGQS